MTYKRKGNEFLIDIYFLEKDFDVKNDENKLKTLCYKCGLCYQHDWEQQTWKLPISTQIISTSLSYSPT